MSQPSRCSSISGVLKLPLPTPYVGIQKYQAQGSCTPRSKFSVGNPKDTDRRLEYARKLGERREKSIISAQTQAGGMGLIGGMLF